MEEGNVSNSLLNQLQFKLKSGLKPTTTKTTFSDGSVQYSSLQGSSCESKKSGTGLGFVVDEKPDLTVGKVNSWLFVSSQDVPCDQTILSEFKISHILSLLPGFVLPPEIAPLISHHLVLDIYDEECFTLDSDIVNQAFTFINEGKKANGKILVHCNAGISRAPTLVIAYLMKEENLSLEQAWEKVKSGRPLIRPNAGFVKQLQQMNNS